MRAETGQDKVIEELKARSAAYSFFARSLAYPRARDEDQKSGDKLFSLLTALPYWQQIEPYESEWQAAGGEWERASDEIADQHITLFDHSRDEMIPPYETDHRKLELHSSVQEMADIAGFYLAFGLRMRGEYGERPDHLGAELEFMSFLAAKERYAVASGNEEQRLIAHEAQVKMMSEHIMKWMPAYLLLLSQNGISPFYARLAKPLSAFLYADYSYLSQVSAHSSILSSSNPGDRESETREGLRGETYER